MKIKQKLAFRYIQLKLKLIALFSKKKAAEKAFQVFCTPFAKPIKKTPAIFEKAEKLNFNLNELSINGYRWNHPKPHKILILHGFSSAAYKFSYYADALINKGYEVLAFDAPAHGKSGGKTTNAVEYSNMIKKVVTLYGPIQSFMAHSFGAMALSLALEEIPNDANTNVVFIAPVTETSTAINTAMGILKLNDSKIRNELDKIILRIGSRPTEWYSLKRIMQHIKATILWVHDEDDDTTPLKDALKVKEDNHPNIEFIITKGLGHRKIYHDASIREKVVDFL